MRHYATLVYVIVSAADKRPYLAHMGELMTKGTVIAPHTVKPLIWRVSVPQAVQVLPAGGRLCGSGKGRNFSG